MYIDTTVIAGIIIFILIITALAIIQAAEKKSSNQMLRENEELKRALYRYNGYEAKGINYYTETDIQKLNRIYNELNVKNKQKLVEYAEALKRRNN